MAVETKLLVPGIEKYDAIVADHNVVGEGEDGVLFTMVGNARENVANHYGQRGLDHLMLIEKLSDPVGYVMVNQITRELEEQFNHRSEQNNLRYEAITNLSVLPKEAKNILRIPYIRRFDVKDDNFNTTNYGLPPDITRKLKNKADFHSFMIENNMSENVPEYVECDIDNLTEVGLHMAKEITEMYQDCQMYDYPVGLIIRSAEGDGQYGSGFVKQLADDYTNLETGQYLKQDSIVFAPDGEMSQAIAFDSWEEALDAAEKSIKQSMNIELESRLVVSRMLDIESPGMSAVVIENEIYPLAWNGQVQDSNSTACRGTANYEGSDGHYFQQSEEILRRIWNAIEPNNEQVNAIFNQDLMVVSEKEKQLWNTIQNNNYLRNKYGRAQTVGYSYLSHTNYTPRVCNPDILLLAEINPRLTNWTLALLAVMSARRMEANLGNISSLAVGNSIKVQARDSVWIPETLEMSGLRAQINEMNAYLAQYTSGLILRMTGKKKVGMIAHSNGSGMNPYEVFDLFDKRVKGI